MNREETTTLALTGDWALWRLAALRTAGLPFSRVAALAVDSGRPTTEAVREALLDPRFREALTWQNPTMMRNWVARHVADLERGCTRLRRRSAREADIAQYLQRYCAKNETIGFFGPVAWARLDEAASGISQTVGHGLRRRQVHFEVWAMDALASAWSRDPRLLPHLVVRFDPSASYRQGTLYRSRRKPRHFDGLDAAVLDAIDGARRAAEVAGEVHRQRPDIAEAHALQRLVELAAEDVVLIGFPIPIDEWPERRLRDYVASIPDVGIRDELLAVLESLEAGRAAVAAAAGDPEAVLAALDRLGHRFTAATGELDIRGKQDVKHGRMIVYEDCRGDIDVTVGRDLIDALRRPLGLILDSARWLTGEVAAAVERQLASEFERLGGTRTGTVPLGSLLFAAGGLLAGTEQSSIHEIVEDFQLRWHEVLPAAGDRAQLSGEEIRPIVQALFPRCPPGWAAARQHSPDLLLCRGDPERDGRPLWVLGELHLALNTVENRVFVTQADDPDELTIANAADMANGRIVPVLPKSWPDVSSRAYPPLGIHVQDRYVYWSFDRDDGHPQARQVLPVADLEVARTGDGLMVRLVTGSWQAPLLECLGEFLTMLVVNRFQLRPPSSHAPRVAIDDLVVCRESWRFPVADVPTPDAGSDDALEKLRGWLLDQGVPRHVFVRGPAEPKPIYVDLAAPLLLRSLIRTVHRANRSAAEAYLDVVEMLPGPVHLWLGVEECHTAEFRLVAAYRSSSSCRSADRVSSFSQKVECVASTSSTVV